MAASKDTPEEEEESRERLDIWLSRGTNAFPFWVLGAALLGYTHPPTLLWVNSSAATILLAAVMMGTGVTLRKEDFTHLLAVPANRIAVPLGVLCQFLIMPSAAYFVGRQLFLTNGPDPPTSLQSALFLGLALVGCAPGGTASNLVSLIARADVALSVVLTTCSTLAAVVVTPLLVQFLVRAAHLGAVADTNIRIRISGWSLGASTAQVVLLPVLCGMWLQSRAPSLARTIGRFTPLVSVLLVSLICGGVVAQTAPLLRGSVGVPLVAVLLLHAMGFAAGYWVPRVMFPSSEAMARTISIEVGMQNSALAVVLAGSIPGLHPAARLPGALSATCHSCLGSLLAAFWRGRSTKKKKKEPPMSYME